MANFHEIIFQISKTHKSFFFGGSSLAVFPWQFSHVDFPMAIFPFRFQSNTVIWPKKRFRKYSIEYNGFPCWLFWQFWFYIEFYHFCWSVCISWISTKQWNCSLDVVRLLKKTKWWTILWISILFLCHFISNHVKEIIRNGIDLKSIVLY